MVYKWYRWNPNFGPFSNIKLLYMCDDTWYHHTRHTLFLLLLLMLVMLLFLQCPEMPAIEMRNKQTMNIPYTHSVDEAHANYKTVASLRYDQIIQCTISIFNGNHHLKHITFRWACVLFCSAYFCVWKKLNWSE